MMTANSMAVSKEMRCLETEKPIASNVSTIGSRPPTARASSGTKVAIASSQATQRGMARPRTIRQTSRDAAVANAMPRMIAPSGRHRSRFSTIAIRIALVASRVRLQRCGISSSPRAPARFSQSWEMRGPSSRPAMCETKPIATTRQAATAATTQSA